MSETPQEPDVPFEEPDEPTPDETPDETEAPSPEEATGPGEVPPDRVAESHAEIEALYTRLETKAKNYVKGMGELLEDRGVPVSLCEMCADAFPGIRWAQPKDEMHAAMLGVIGAAGGESPLLIDPDAQKCDRCDGFGWNKLPSHVPGNEQRMCRVCKGAGYLDTNPQSGALQPPADLPPNGPVEEIAGVPETDPAVIELRARGFTIIPPMQIGAAAEPA